jgi:hypothetical protein
LHGINLKRHNVRVKDVCHTRVPGQKYVDALNDQGRPDSPIRGRCISIPTGHLEGVSSNRRRTHLLTITLIRGGHDDAENHEVHELFRTRLGCLADDAVVVRGEISRSHLLTLSQTDEYMRHFRQALPPSVSHTSSSSWSGLSSPSVNARMADNSIQSTLPACPSRAYESKLRRVYLRPYA